MRCGKHLIRIGCLLATAALGVGHANGQVTFNWVLDGTGNWNTDLNWEDQFGTNGVPNNDAFPGDGAAVGNGGTAVVSGNVPSVAFLNVTNGGVEVNNGGVLDVAGDALVGGSGQLSLSGNGTLNVAGNLSNAGLLELIGSDATLDVEGALGLSGTFWTRIQGDDLSTATAGSAVLGGTLRARLSGVTPALGDSWEVIDADSIDGNFANVETTLVGSSLARGLWFESIVQDNSAFLSVGSRLVLNVNRVTGAVSIENPAGPALDFDSFAIRSGNGLLVPGELTGLGGMFVDANQSANHLTQLNLTGVRSIGVGETISLGTPYVSGNVPFPDEDLTFQYSMPDGSLLDGIVEFTGPPNALTLQVDPTTGEAAIQNLSTFIDAPVIDSYAILSNSGSLVVDGWDSFNETGDAGEGWQTANPLETHLTELNLTGSTTFTTGKSISIGDVFSTVVGIRDLVFQFSTAAGVFDGVVQYGPIGGGGLASDFNGDGAVNLADFNILKGNFGMAGGMANGDANGDGQVNLADFNILKGEFGQEGSEAVPEPSTVILGALALLGLVVSSRAGLRKK